MCFYFRKASEGLKTINPYEKAPSMRLLAYGKLELHSVVKIKKKKKKPDLKAIFIFYSFVGF